MLLRPKSRIRLALVVLALAVPSGRAEPPAQRGLEHEPSVPLESAVRSTGGVSDGDDWLG